jgi:hypothetical protein
LYHPADAGAGATIRAMPGDLELLTARFAGRDRRGARPRWQPSCSAGSEWSLSLNAFAITFGDRFPAAEIY